MGVRGWGQSKIKVTATEHKTPHKRHLRGESESSGCEGNTHTHSQSATLLTNKELQRLWLNWYQHIVSYGLTRQQEAVWCGAVLRALLTLCVDALGLRGLKFSSPSALDMIFTLSAASILLLSMSFFILRFSS